MKLTDKVDVGLARSLWLQAVLTGLAVGVALLTGPWAWGISVLIGALTSLIYQLHILRLSKRAIALPPAYGVALMRSGSVLRFILICAIVLIAIRLNFFNLWWILGGFFLGQAVFLRDLVRLAIRL